MQQILLTLAHSQANSEVGKQAFKAVKKEEDQGNSMNGTIPPLRPRGGSTTPAPKSPNKMPPMGYFSNNASPKRRDVRDKDGNGVPRN